MIVFKYKGWTKGDTLGEQGAIQGCTMGDTMGDTMGEQGVIQWVDQRVDIMLYIGYNLYYRFLIILPISELALYTIDYTFECMGSDIGGIGLDSRV